MCKVVHVLNFLFLICLYKPTIFVLEFFSPGVTINDYVYRQKTEDSNFQKFISLRMFLRKKVVVNMFPKFFTKIN